VVRDGDLKARAEQLLEGSDNAFVVGAPPVLRELLDLVSGLFILHSCDNRPCVNPAHLRAGTPKDNAHDAMVRDRVLFGERNESAKLTEAQVLEMRELRQAGWKSPKLAKRFGVAQGIVLQICKGNLWRRSAGPLQPLVTPPKPPVTEKACTACGVVKPLAGFHSGRNACRKCRNAMRTNLAAKAKAEGR